MKTNLRQELNCLSQVPCQLLIKNVTRFWNEAKGGKNQQALEDVSCPTSLIPSLP